MASNEVKLYIKNQEAKALISIAIAIDKIFTEMKKKAGKEISLDALEEWRESYNNKVIQHTKFFSQEMIEDCNLNQSLITALDIL